MEELRKEFDAFVAGGMKLIHGPQSRDQVLERVKQASTPQQGAAEALLMVFRRLETKHRAPDEIKPDAGNVLLGQIIEVAEAAGVHQFSEEERQEAYTYAVQRYTEEEVQAGRMDPAQLEQMVQGMSQQPQQPQQPEEQPGLLSGGHHVG